MEKISERFADRSPVQPDRRTHKATDSAAGLTCSINITALADAEEHLFELSEVAPLERLALENLHHKMVLVRSQQTSRRYPISIHTWPECA